MQKMQKGVWDHFENAFLEHEKFTSHLEAQMKQLEQYEKQLEHREVQIENDRRKLQHDKEMNQRATLEQKKANEEVVKLAEEQKKAKEELHKKIIELEKKLDAKQALELEIERMRGALQVMKHMGAGDEDMEYNQKMEKVEEELREKEERYMDVESLYHTLYKKIIELEKKLDAKQALELEIERMRGALHVMKHMGGDENMEYNQKMEKVEEELKEMEEEFDDVEELYHTLLTKERITNDELQEARKALIESLKDQKMKKEPLICVKRMGELSSEPFLAAAKRKFPDEEASIKAMEHCSQWEDYLRDPSWHPFRIITVDGVSKEIMNEEDEKLRQLKEEYGDDVYEAVKTALTETNEYNPGGRYVVCELWNNEKKRRAKLKEGVLCLLNHYKQLKPTAKRKRN